jgi:hypothetical protein
MFKTDRRRTPKVIYPLICPLGEHLTLADASADWLQWAIETAVKTAGFDDSGWGGKIPTADDVSAEIDRQTSIVERSARGFVEGDPRGGLWVSKRNGTVELYVHPWLAALYLSQDEHILEGPDRDAKIGSVLGESVPVPADRCRPRLRRA